MRYEELLPYPFKKVKDSKTLPPNDFDFQCFIMFDDGRISLSDGGTVCADRGQIIGWMYLHEAADFMNDKQGKR